MSGDLAGPDTSADAETTDALGAFGMRTFAEICGVGALFGLSTISGCYTGIDVEHGPGIFLPGADDGESDGDSDGEGEAAEAPPPERVQLRRLTRAQYGASMVDLLGPNVEIPESLEPDLVVSLFANVGASEAVLSDLGTEQLEAAAREVAEQVVADAAWRSEVVGCDATAPGCINEFIPRFGRRAFRRALTVSEHNRYNDLAADIEALRSDRWEALEGVMTAMLASPNFIYVVELGEPDPEDDSRMRFTSMEMATRLSLAIWGSGPDEQLLAAAEEGTLTDAEVLAAEAERMLADPRARRGLGRFFAEWLGLDVLDGMTKDAALFPDADEELFTSMRGQVEHMVDAAVFDGGSLLDLIDGRETFVNDRLAQLYGVPAPSGVDAEGFGAVTLPEDSGRRGILGTGAFLAAQARRTRTSPTLRGVWVQARLRCHELPPPPPDVETDLPEGGGTDGKTLREILEMHREDPVCAGCHAQVDPIGLSLEHYDAVGRWRAKDGSYAIDDSVELDGVALNGLGELAEHLADDPALSTCIVRQLYRYTTGHHEIEEEKPAIEQMAARLVDSDYDFVDLVSVFVTSPQFRTLAITE